MAYTVPTTRSTGDLITAAIWNADIVDNLNAAFPLQTGDAVWTTWTPTWTNLTVGNGTTVAVYQRVGRYIFFYLKFTLGSTSSVGTAPNFTLPVTEAARYASAGIDTIGRAALLDAATNVFSGQVSWLSAGVARVEVWNAASTYLLTAAVTATVPMTWTTSDAIIVQGWYESLS